MDIENLTIKQAKELACLFKNQNSCNSFLQDYVGKYVIVRTRNEGINAGKVEKIDNTGVVLSGARRIYYHKPKDKSTSWYEGVATSGLSDDSKISSPVTKVIVEDYSLTICTSEAEHSIRNKNSNEQN